MISFVYFDVGGVVVKDFSASGKWNELREELGIAREKQKLFEEFFRNGEKENCTTKDIETLLPTLQKVFDAHIPQGYSLLNAFVRRFEKNESLWPVLSLIHASSPVGLLTNMYPGMLGKIQERGNFPDILWDKIIDSSVVGYIKPEKEIFRIAEVEAKMPVTEMLLVENSKTNIDAAKSLGWKTFLYDSQDYEKSSKELLLFWEGIKK